MTYLTETEFLKLGFEDVEDFETLAARASSLLICISKLLLIISPLIFEQTLFHEGKRSKRR